MGRPSLAHKPCPDCGAKRNAETAYLAGRYLDGSPRYTTRCKQCHSTLTKCHKQSARREAGYPPLAERPQRTHCDNGHPLDGRRGKYLRCLTCHREQAKARARAKGVPPQWRTHCPQGHELTPDNIRGGSRGRSCSLCHRLRQRRVLNPEAKRYAAVVVCDPCVYCGGPGGTLEHIKPLAKGGTDDWWNFAGACHSCNARKRTTELLPFLLKRMTNGEHIAQARS